MFNKRKNPIFAIADSLGQVESDNMPNAENASPELRAAQTAADKIVYALGDEVISFWEGVGHDVVFNAEYDGFEKGFLTGVSIALASPTRAMQITSAYYESCSGSPVILPIIAISPEVCTTNAAK